MEDQTTEANEPIEVEAALDVTALGAIAGAEINSQIATARRFPRSVAKFRKDLQEWVMFDPDLAAQMFYCLPRGKDENGNKKFVEGPSVRLAEAACAAWGNTRTGARPLEADATHVTCQGFAHDLERNNFCAFEVKRRITGKFGRFNEDMITVTASAGTAIAWRQAIFKIIPRAFINEAFKRAKMVAAHAVKSVSDARKEALEWWQSQGGHLETLLALFARQGLEELSIDDLVRVRGVKTAIEDGDITFADLIRDVMEDQAAKVKVGTLSADSVLKGRATGKDDAKKEDPRKAPPAPAEPKVEEKPKAAPPVADAPPVATLPAEVPAEAAREIVAANVANAEPVEPPAGEEAKARSLFAD